MLLSTRLIDFQKWSKSFGDEKSGYMFASAEEVAEVELSTIDGGSVTL